MPTKKPRVSVIMPIYNADLYLKEAVDSILGQTFADFELIAIDDGSKDKSGKIIDHYASIDPRITVIHQENHGLVFTLNKGIDLAQGEFIARMDSDDVSFPRRFELQLEAFDKDPDVVLVAGGFEIIDEESEFLYREVVAATDRDLKRSMLLRNPIAHGSVMFRKSACIKVGKYSDSCGPIEDFELWSRLALVGTFVGLEATIFRWRVNRKGITSNNNKLQLELMKHRVSILWANNFPEVISAKTLRESGRRYFKTYKKRGFDMRNVILADNAQIAFQMMRRGQLLKGTHQFFAVATASRTGFRLAMHCLRLTIRHTSHGIRRYAKIGRQEV